MLPRTRSVNSTCRYDRGAIYCTLVPIYFIAVKATRAAEVPGLKAENYTLNRQYCYLMARAFATPSAETPIERRYSAIFLSRAAFSASFFLRS